MSPPRIFAVEGFFCVLRLCDCQYFSAFVCLVLYQCLIIFLVISRKEVDEVHTLLDDSNDPAYNDYWYSAEW
jgi:hypothetical protein